MNETTTETTPLTIVICGPNLRTRDATMHVHSPGCADLRNYGRFGRLGGDDEGWTVTLDDFDPKRGVAYAAARCVYEDHISDYGYEYDSPEAIQYWGGCSADIKVFPCVAKAQKAEVV